MHTYRGSDIPANGQVPRGHLDRFHRDESGAIVLLGLVGVMILMLLAWVLYDAGQMARHKLTVQSAADTAAYSQAAVKARAMNNLAYANIAKRSVVGIHSQYSALWAAYRDWYMEHVAKCAAGNEQSCTLVADNTAIVQAEQQNDFKTFRDELGEKYYLQDIIAIDNFQRYTHALTPWWGWGEAVLRASRNGAGMAASFPAPRGQAKSAATVNTITDRVISAAGWSPLVPYSGHRDMLPVKVSDYEDMLERAMGPEMSFFQREYDANLEKHKQASEGAAASQELLDRARLYFPDAVLNHSESVFKKHGRPWRLFETSNPARWTSWTSNMVLTYRRKEELFGEMRQKYDTIERDYTHQDEEKYRNSGYWGMARAEISFQGGFRAPDLWHPRWTARLRPVALPDEFRQTGLQMSAVFHDVLPYLALSGVITTGDSSIVEESFDDLVFMERAQRALGQSTVEGIAK